MSWRRKAVLVFVSSGICLFALIFALLASNPPEANWVSEHEVPILTRGVFGSRIRFPQPDGRCDIWYSSDAPKAELEKTRDRSSEVWAVATLEDVKQNLARVNYPAERIKFVKGPVEETIPEKSPKDAIALLRLDTDWYESTRHELIHLFPKLSPCGVLILDDYGHWEGAKKAVDEYFSGLKSRYFFHRIDYSARLVVNLPVT